MIDMQQDHQQNNGKTVQMTRKEKGFEFTHTHAAGRVQKFSRVEKNHW
jgi:hypothetical protein